jgi:hypothetical protein
LEQNYPNPFNPETKIRFSLPVEGIVSLKIYDITGRLVTELLNEYKNAGYHEIVFDTNKLKLSSGVYVYRLEAEGFNAVKKMILLK